MVFAHRIHLDIADNIDTLSWQQHIPDWNAAGTTAINGTGNTLNNLVRGNTAVNTLSGGTGNDILEGGDGNDILTDTSGTALFNGGAGADTITGGAGAEIFLGGLGNDTYTTAGGNDIILFNKGDGQDTFTTGGTGSDAISLRGGHIGQPDGAVREESGQADHRLRPSPPRSPTRKSSSARIPPRAPRRPSSFNPARRMKNCA